MQHDAVKSYQKNADDDDTNAAEDVARAQALLEALVLEIAPVAREETEERVKLAAALKVQEAMEKGIEELGTETTDSDTSVVTRTGALEILF